MFLLHALAVRRTVGLPVMPNGIEFTLNGRGVHLEAVSPNSTLLEYLRGGGDRR